jgi:hypothetical protein
VSTQVTELSAVIRGSNQASPAFQAASKDARAFGQVITADSREVVELQAKLVMLNRQHELGTMSSHQYAGAMKELTADARGLAQQVGTATQAEAALARVAQQASAAAASTRSSGLMEARKMDSLVGGLGALTAGGEGAAAGISKVSNALMFLTASNPELFAIIAGLSLVVGGIEAVTRASEESGVEADALRQKYVELGNAARTLGALQHLQSDRAALQAVLNRNTPSLDYGYLASDATDDPRIHEIVKKYTQVWMRPFLSARAVLENALANMLPDESAIRGALQENQHDDASHAPAPHGPKGPNERLTRIAMENAAAESEAEWMLRHPDVRARRERAEADAHYRRVTASNPHQEVGGFNALTQPLPGQSRADIDRALRRVSSTDLDPQVKQVKALAEHMNHLALYTQLSVDAFQALVLSAGQGGDVFGNLFRHEAHEFGMMALAKAAYFAADAIGDVLIGMPGRAVQAGAAALAYGAAAATLLRISGGGSHGAGAGGGSRGGVSDRPRAEIDNGGRSQQHTTQIVFVTPDGREISRQIVQNNARQERLGAPSVTRIPLNAVVLGGPIQRAG